MRVSSILLFICLVCVAITIKKPVVIGIVSMPSGYNVAKYNGMNKKYYSEIVGDYVRTLEDMGAETVAIDYKLPIKDV